jgi:hypothetical protein
MAVIRRHSSRETLPSSNRADDTMQGHWLLARLGKRCCARAVSGSPAN